MTQEGYDQLKTELKHMTSIERPEVINAIAEARAHGDLSENAEYHAAKERQGYIEGRIQELNGKLSSANVIDVSKLSGDKIIFGATVKFVDVDTDDEKCFKIVGEDEADLEKNMISVNSPIARALIGKKEGDILVIPIPKGTIEVEVLDVQFLD